MISDHAPREEAPRRRESVPAPRSRFTWAAAVAASVLALPLSQLGHALAYALRHGAAAGARQASGAHSYFPALFGAAVAVLAGLLLSGLLLIGLARYLVSLRGAPAVRTSWPVLPLVMILTGIQAAVFFGQEATEVVSSSLRPEAIPALLALGIGGQLPVALAAGLALAWMSTRVTHAIQALRQTRLAVPSPPPGGGVSPPRPTSVLVGLAAGPRRLNPRRGPPTLLPTHLR